MGNYWLERDKEDQDRLRLSLAGMWIRFQIQHPEMLGDIREDARVILDNILESERAAIACDYKWKLADC